MRVKRALIISYHYFPESVVGARRPTELARSLQSAGWQVDVLTRRMTAHEERQRAENQDIGTVFSIYKHPGILGPTWRFFKRLRGEGGGSTVAEDAGVNEAAQHRADSGAHNESAATEERKETLKQRARRILITLQALMDATKSWVALSILYLLFWRIVGRRYDIIISSSPPATVHLLALWGKLLFRCRWVADLRDQINMWDAVLPECKSRFRVVIEDYLERKYMQRADQVVVTSPSLATKLAERFFPQNPTKVHTIYNGFDRDFVERGPSHSDGLRMIYAGELYLDRDPIPFFEAVQSLIVGDNLGPDKLKLDLYGKCDVWNGIDLKQWIHARNLDDSIQIHGFLTPEELEPLLEDAHVLINFAQKRGSMIPAKTFDHLAYQGVVLVVAERDGDTAQLILNHRLGYVVESNSESIATALRDIYHQVVTERTLEVVDRDTKSAFSRASQNQMFIELCESQFVGGYCES